MIDKLIAVSLVEKAAQNSKQLAQGIEVSTATHVMNATDIFQQVCSFYDAAWNNLIVFSGISFAIIGIIIPIVISYIQNKSIAFQIIRQKNEFKK